MEIKFLGPLGKVTGSCCWMRDIRRGWNFLIDCGMQQGESTAKAWNACNWPFNPVDLDFVVLTHAHVDHSGLIPALYQQGFKGPVYATTETRELAEVLLKDAARFPECPFTPDDVNRVCWKEPTSKPLLGRHHPIAQDLFLQFFRTGHVVGAVSVAVYWGAPGKDQLSIVFSGDVGPNVEDSENIPFLRHRMNPGRFDYAVLESTYGNLVRPIEETNPEERRNGLRRWLDRTIDESGVLVIPAFALGRTQDILFDLHWIIAENPEKYGDLNFLMDSPSAIKTNKIVLRALERTEGTSTGKVRPLWMGKQMFRWFGLDPKTPEHATYVRALCQMTLEQKRISRPSPPPTANRIARAWQSIFSVVENRKQLADRGLPDRTVLVVSSGTGDGGPAAFWLSKLLMDERTGVAFPGYCSPSTIGGKLQALAHLPLKERAALSDTLNWQGSQPYALEQSSIKASVGMLSGYSAHADQAGLVEWAFNGDRKIAVASTVFLQHGEDSKREALSDVLLASATREETPMRVICPGSETPWLNLDHGADEVNRQQEVECVEAQIAQLQRHLAKLQSATGNASLGSNRIGVTGF